MPLLRIATVLLTAVSAVTAQAGPLYDVGLREIRIGTSEPGRDLAVTIWYPASGGGKSAPIGDNRVFRGAPAVIDAAPTAGAFPLVLLSHGSGGRAQGMSWLASELAKAGFVVAGPDHPGTMSGDSTPADTPKIWQRTGDLSAVIARLTADPVWSAIIDKDSIGIVGFSLGGAAAMEIAGARASLEDYARYCDSYRQWDCAWFAGGVGYRNEARIKVDKVDLRALDRARFEQSNRDARIKSAVLVDPALAQAYDEESLASIAIPMSFINLGDAGTIPPGVDAGRLATLVPQGTYASVAGATHFSFLPECKEGAADFLKSVGEVDPICDDDARRPRAEIHGEATGIVLAALLKTLKSQP